MGLMPLEQSTSQNSIFPETKLSVASKWNGFMNSGKQALKQGETNKCMNSINITLQRKNWKLKNGGSGIASDMTKP